MLKRSSVVLGLCALAMGVAPLTVGAQQEARANGASTLLDAPVDRTAYVLGPGDVVDLSIFGEANHLHRLTVTPEGAVVVPLVGIVSVLGQSLEEAQRQVRQRVLQYYRNVDVYLTLSQLRQFKVFVLGDVPAPGVHIASAATRASEMIATAGGASVISAVDTVLGVREDSVVGRNVVLRRASGETRKLDLARFRRLGNLGENPMLREGDALIVPAVDRTVTVRGRFFFPGTYEYREGESLADLLVLANGVDAFPADAADSLRISRQFAPGQRQVYVLTREEAMGERGRGFVLAPFDAVYLAGTTRHNEQNRATVGGMVAHPGTYPIQPGRTTVRDLISLAGGLGPDAGLAAATLRRRPPGADQRLLEQLRSLPPELLSPEDRRLLVASQQGDEANVVVDFHQLLAEGESVYDQVLRSGDVLQIPERRNEVTILGAVLRPGIVQHAADLGVDQFVQLAGGYGRKADRGDVVVIKAGAPNRIDADDVRSVEPGDVIVVPFRERTDWLRALQTTSTVVTTITGMVLTFMAFGR